MNPASVDPEAASRFAAEARASGLALPTARRFNPRIVLVAVAVIVAASVSVGYATGWMNLSRPAVNPLDQLPLCPPGGVTVSVAAEPDLAGAVASAWPSLVGGFGAATGHCLIVRSGTTDSAFGALTGHSAYAELGPELPAAAGPGTLGGATFAVPLLVSPVVVVVNANGLGGSVSLSAPALAGILLGTITAWNAPELAATNPGWSSSEPISVVTLAGPSVTNGLLSSYLADHSPSFRSDVGVGANVTFPVGTVEPTETAVLSEVERTNGSVGYVASDVCPTLPIGVVCASLQSGSSTFVSPSAASVAAAASLEANSTAAVAQQWQNVSGVAPWNTSVYPLVQTTYAVMYRDLGVAYGDQVDLNTSKWLIALFFWIASDTGGGVATVGVASGFVALPTTLGYLGEIADLSVTYLGGWILAPPGAVLEESGESGGDGGETGEF